VLDAFYAGRLDDAEKLQDYITNSRGPIGDLNAELGDSPDASPTSVYCIAANKALAAGLEGNTGPCRLPLGSLRDEAAIEALRAAVLPYLTPLDLAASGGALEANATRGKL
jgi:hypothetical protein